MSYKMPSLDTELDKNKSYAKKYIQALQIISKNSSISTDDYFLLQCMIELYTRYLDILTTLEKPVYLGVIFKKQYEKTNKNRVVLFESLANIDFESEDFESEFLVLLNNQKSKSVIGNLRSNARDRKKSDAITSLLTGAVCLGLIITCIATGAGVASGITIATALVSALFVVCLLFLKHSLSIEQKYSTKNGIFNLNEESVLGEKIAASKSRETLTVNQATTLFFSDAKSYLTTKIDTDYNKLKTTPNLS